MRLTSLHRESWFGFRLALTALLAFILVFGRLPLAGATEEPADDAQVTTASDDGEGAEVTAEPTEAAPTEPAEAAPSEVAPSDDEVAPVDEEPIDEPKDPRPAPAEEPEEDPAPTLESPRRSATKVAGAETLDRRLGTTSHQVGHAGNASADLDQWANLAPGSWQNGNLNQSNSSYVEGDTVPFRMRMDGLGLGITHTLTIEWDVTKSGTHAYDYIQSYDDTETANPCTGSGVTPCVEALPTSTSPISADTQVTSPTNPPPGSVAQEPGEFTMWGANITSVSAYSGAGTTVADGSRRVTITFTSVTDEAVMAWGGHVSSRIQWDPQLTSAQIAGSPYHMRLIEINGKAGNQDRSLSANSVLIPLISVEKTVDPTTVNAGTQVTYSYLITNIGEMDLTSITLDDDRLPPITLTDTTLAVGESMTITVDYTPNNTDAANSPIVNTATVTGTAISGDVVTDQDTASLIVNPMPIPDISFAKTSTAPAGGVSSDGGSFDYELAVTNSSTATAAATNVVVTDTVPAGLDIDSASWAIGAGAPTNCTITGQDVSCTIGSLPINSTATVTISVTADESVCGNVTNDGEVTGGNFTTQNDDVTVALICPDVSFAKTSDAPAGGVLSDGGSFEYELTVTNDAGATDDARNVVVTDDVPAGLDITSASWAIGAGASTACGVLAQAVSCNIGTLTPGQSAVVTIAVTADDSVCANVTNDGAAAGSNFTTLNDDTTVALICPDVDFTKTSDAPAGGVLADGGSFNYLLTVSNDAAATGPATNVVVTDTVPAGLDITSATWAIGAGASTACGVVGQDVTCTIGDLDPGESAVVTIAVTADDSVCGNVTNDGAAAGGNFTTLDDDVTVALLCPDVSFTKTSDAATGGELSDGGSFNYLLTVTNDAAATGPATNVVVTDTVPAGLDITSATWAIGAGASTACGVVGQDVTCTIGDLDPGESAVVTIAVTADDSVCDDVTNAGAASGGNFDTLNDDVTVILTCPGVTFAKTSTAPAGGVLADGGTFDYELTVTNSATATGPANDVVVTDDVPLGLSINSATWGLAATPCGVAGQIVSCSIGTLTPGQSAVVTINVTADDSICDDVTNDGAVSGSNFPNDDDSVTVALTCPDVDFVKTSTAPAGGVLADGGTFDYTLTVSNDAAATGRATDVVVTDTVPAGLDITSATWTPTGGAATPCTVTGQGVSCAIGDLDPGESAVVTIAVTADDSVCGNVTNDGAAAGGNFQTLNDDVTVALTCPDVDFVKTSTAPAGGVLADGGTFDYTLTVSNDAAATGRATDVVVTDTVPAGLTINSATWTIGAAAPTACAIAGQGVTCTIGDLQPGQSAIVTIAVTADDSVCGDVTNDGEAAGGNFATLDDAVTVALTCPDVDFVKTSNAPGGEVLADGGTFDYVLTVGNDAGATGRATSVVVSDTVPAGLDINSANWAIGAGAATACGVVAQAVTCTIGDLQPGETAVVTINVTADDSVCGDVTNDGAAAGGNFTTINDDVTVALTCPDVDFVKTSNAPAGGVLSDGGTFDYLLSVSNDAAATGPATSVVVSDTVPAGLVINSANWAIGAGAATACGVVAQAVTCTIGDLQPGETAVATINVTADDSECADVTNDGSAAGGNFTTINDDVTVALICPDVDFAKTSNAPGGEVLADGGTFDYVLTVGNDAAATGPANDVVVTDEVPDGLTINSASWALGANPATACGVAGQVVSCTIGTLTPGQSAVVTINVTADDSECADVTNDGAVSGSNFLNDDDSVTVGLTCPDVDFAKTSNAAGGMAESDGGTFDYVLTVGNDAAATGRATSVVVTDTIPAGLSINSANWAIGSGAATACGVAGQDVTCTIGDLQPGESAVVTINVTGDDTVCGLVTNAGAVNGGNFLEDTDSADVTLTCPDVTLAKSASQTSVGFNDAYSYSITATNAGNGAAKGLVITDDLHDDLVVVDATYVVGGGAPAACTPGVGAGNTIECNVGDLAGNGATAVVTINVQATEAACGDVDNTASSNHSPDSNTVTVLIACPVRPPDIELTKTVSPATAGLGDTVTYTYLIENTGQQTLSSITLVDDKLGDIALGEDQTVLGVGQSTTATAEHVITQANVDAGSLTNVATATGLSPSNQQVMSTSSAIVNSPQDPDIEVVKSADVPGADVGDTITYTYVITNTGNVTLTDVALVDDVIGQILDGAAGTTLAPGDSMTVDSDYVATDADADNQQVTNVATATGNPPTGAPVTHRDTVTVPVGRTLVEPTDFLTVEKDVVGDHDGERYSYSVDCGRVGLGKDGAFSLPADGGSREVGVAIEVGTQCKVVETDAGGADSTTAAVNNGDPRATRSAIATIREGGSTVRFVNTFDVAPTPDPELPATGTNAAQQLIVALAALLLGTGLVRATRPRRPRWMRA